MTTATVKQLYNEVIVTGSGTTTVKQAYNEVVVSILSNQNNSIYNQFFAFWV